MTQRTVIVDGTTFAYLEDGPADADLVLLVHGFPDSPRSWSTVIERLSAAGHRVVAPFQRGYAPTQVPTDGRYQPGRLALDVAGLVEALSNGRPVTLVGHDWGALAVYGAANLVPDRVRAVVGMSIPPGLSPTDLVTYEQAKRSFYVWLFQLPVDEAVAADDHAFIGGLWNDWTMAGTDTVAALAAAKDAVREPAHLAAALGYYRALFAPDLMLEREQRASETTPSQPFLYLHGAEDACMATSISDHVTQRRVVAGANHFLHLDQPEVTIAAILEMLP